MFEGITVYGEVCLNLCVRPQAWMNDVGYIPSLIYNKRLEYVRMCVFCYFFGGILHNSAHRMGNRHIEKANYAEYLQGKQNTIHID